MPPNFQPLAINHWANFVSVLLLLVMLLLPWYLWLFLRFMLFISILPAMAGSFHFRALNLHPLFPSSMTRNNRYVFTFCPHSVCSQLTSFCYLFLFCFGSLLLLCLFWSDGSSPSFPQIAPLLISGIFSLP